MTDRELDARVARVVMGDKAVRKDYGEGEETLPWIPHYCTTGDGMLAVVEAMRGKGYSWAMASRDGNGENAVYFTLPDPSGRSAAPPLASGSAWGYPLHRAVCLAALKAMGP